MPVPIRTPRDKNIWVAAGDGDLVRVRDLIEGEGLSPNVPDPNTYTPMHAAASYGHLDVLDYLISQGGDVNVTDEDGDTPLYVVENVETARYLVEHGAVVARQNHEGQTPAAYLAEDFAEVAAYLESIAPSATAVPVPPSVDVTEVPSSAMPSQHAQNAATEMLTSSLMQSVEEVMLRADAEGRDPDEELRQVIGRHVLEGVAAGYGLSEQAQTQSEERGREERDAGDAKRSRTDDGSGPA